MPVSFKQEVDLNKPRAHAQRIEVPDEFQNPSSSYKPKSVGGDVYEVSKSGPGHLTGKAVVFGRLVQVSRFASDDNGEWKYVRTLGRL